MWFALNIPQAQNSFWTHPMELLGDEAQVESCFDPFGDSVTIRARQVHGCANQGSEIISEAPDGTPR